MICVSSYDSGSCDYCDKNPDRQIDIIKTIINFSTFVQRIGLLSFLMLNFEWATLHFSHVIKS